MKRECACLRCNVVHVLHPVLLNDRRRAALCLRRAKCNLTCYGPVRRAAARHLGRLHLHRHLAEMCRRRQRNCAEEEKRKTQYVNGLAHCPKSSENNTTRGSEKQAATGHGLKRGKSRPLKRLLIRASPSLLSCESATPASYRSVQVPGYPCSRSVIPNMSVSPIGSIE